MRTAEGLWAVAKGQPIEAAAVECYLRAKVGDMLGAVRAAMERLAGLLPQAELARPAFRLYEGFRPAVPEGESGWSAEGVLDHRPIAPE